MTGFNSEEDKLDEIVAEMANSNAEPTNDRLKEVIMIAIEAERRWRNEYKKCRDLLRNTRKELSTAQSELKLLRRLQK